MGDVNTARIVVNAPVAIAIAVVAMVEAFIAIV